MALGGNVRLIVTGAAPLSAKVMMFLRCTMGVCCVSQQRVIVDFGAVLSRLVSKRDCERRKGQIIVSCYNVQFVFTSLRNLNFFILCQLGPFSRQSAIAWRKCSWSCSFIFYFKVVEGYGQTESTAAATITCPRDTSVGKAKRTFKCLSNL